MEQKILTLAEKWEIDAQAYRDGASVIIMGFLPTLLESA